MTKIGPMNRRSEALPRETDVEARELISELGLAGWTVVASKFDALKRVQRLDHDIVKCDLQQSAGQELLVSLTESDISLAPPISFDRRFNNDCTGIPAISRW